MLAAEFDVADDLLWQAQQGRLATLSPIVIRRSGLIGPLVEIAYAWRKMPAQYASVCVDAPIFGSIFEALDDRRVSGSGARDVAGVFPLALNGEGADPALWDQWLSHAENAAVRSGIAPGLAARLIGALGELQENAHQHSADFESGLVAYAAPRGAFEFVVADAGQGVLASLRQNPAFAYLEDSGEALRVAASDGTSRHGDESGRGYGIGQLFRALAHDAGDLRFRSGTHVLRLWGDAPSLTGQFEVTKKARTCGLIVSVRCALRGRG